MFLHRVENDLNPTGLGDASRVVVVDRQAPECPAGVFQKRHDRGMQPHRVGDSLDSSGFSNQCSSFVGFLAVLFLKEHTQIHNRRASVFQEKFVGPMIVHGLDDRFDTSPRLGDASPVVVVAPNQMS